MQIALIIRGVIIIRGAMRKAAFIIFLSFLRWMTARSQEVTYQTVEPIFLNRCVACHRPGDAAPFSLTTYADISKRISFIKEVITKSYMPPWRADVHYRDFANNRMLTEQEKKTLLEWIDNKAPKGANPLVAARSGTTNISEKEKLQSVAAREELLKVTAYRRKPDLTLKIDSAFTVKGDNLERFILFKVPFEFSETHTIEAIEFFTNNKRILHHINYGFYEVADTAVDIYGGRTFINTTEEESPKQDPYGAVKKRMTYYTGWIPGASPESYPKDFGWVLPRRGVILLTAHYSAIAQEEKSVVGVNLFFRKDSVKRSVRIISLGSGGIAENDISPPLFIPAARVSTFHLKVKTQEEQSLLCVWPHMHLLGKEFYAYAVTPSGDTINLVHIPNWDFRWQELYKFKKLIRIPKGSVVNMDCTYDNTADNPFNPNSPPRGIFSLGDMSSTNEMMTLLLIYVAYQDGDEQILPEE